MRLLQSVGGMGSTRHSRWVSIWLQPLLDALVNGSTHAKGNLSTYVLPMILTLDSSSLAAMLEKAVELLRGDLTSETDGHVSYLTPQMMM